MPNTLSESPPNLHGLETFLSFIRADQLEIVRKGGTPLLAAHFVLKLINVK